MRGKFLKLAADSSSPLYVEKRASGSSVTGIRVNLSLRQLIRIARLAEEQPTNARSGSDILRKAIERALMTDFMPLEEKVAVNTVLDNLGFGNQSDNASESSSRRNSEIQIHQLPHSLTIGDIEYKIVPPREKALIPETLFFPIPAHIALLRDMLADFKAGEHLLLLGNQGVGKNKLTDKFLQLIQKEREYVQLHRDTTVQNLTLLPSIKNNRVVFEDSALVRSMRHGRILVIDEFDKAPAEVVMILKQLVADGEITLNNTRFVSNKLFDLSGTPPPGVEVIHEGFRIIALANRPGWPFLGNDFYKSLGDCFAAFQVANPDPESEYLLLCNYAPDLAKREGGSFLLRQLVKCFQDLRKLVDEGKVAYPYSTRELVSIAKHLENFPAQPTHIVLENVFAFDFYDATVRREVRNVFGKHGIPFGDSDTIYTSNLGDISSPCPVRLSKSKPLPEPKLVTKLLETGSRELSNSKL